MGTCMKWKLGVAGSYSKFLSLHTSVAKVYLFKPIYKCVVMSGFYCIRPRLLKTIFVKLHCCRYKLLHVSDYSNPYI